MAAIDAIGAIGAVGATAGAQGSAASAQVNSLGLDDFMKILLTQLTYQDPLKPMDNQAFITQLAQFTSLQLAKDSNQGLQQLLAIESTNQAVALLGKTVDVQADDGSASTGEVSAIRFSNGSPLMTVKQANGSVLTDVPLSRIALMRI